jgi:hypothetical protein
MRAQQRQQPPTGESGAIAESIATNDDNEHGSGDVAAMESALLRSMSLRPDLAADVVAIVSQRDLQNPLLREAFDVAATGAGFVGVHEELVRRGAYRDDTDASELFELLDRVSDTHPASEAVVYAAAVRAAADHRRTLDALSSALVSLEAGGRRDAVLSRLREQLAAVS